MSRQYNARLVDWICCPDCGCNVIRAEGLYPDGTPQGQIECVTCGFTAMEAAEVHVYEDWSQICDSVGHEWKELAELADGRTVKACLFCGKQVIS